MMKGYVQNAEGKWEMTAESRAESLALYYSGRLAYDPQDLRHAIGRYNAQGEVIKFQPWPSKVVAETQE